MRAGLQPIAADATRGIHVMSILCENMCAPIAQGDAPSASNTPVLIEHHPTLHEKGFRIMAPTAAKIAAHQKCGCPHARTIMQGKALYAHDQTHDCHFATPLLQHSVHHMSLEPLVQIDKSRVESPYANNQILMLFRMNQRILQHRLVVDGDADKSAGRAFHSS